MKYLLIVKWKNSGTETYGPYDEHDLRVRLDDLLTFKHTVRKFKVVFL